MIAFEELVVALNNWRMRNGLPVSTGDVPSSPVARATPAPMAAAPMPASMPFGAPVAAPMTTPRPVSPVTVPSTESDVMSIDDAEVEDDLYENEGDDFAMQFGSAPPAAQPAPAPQPALAYEDGEYDDDQAAYAPPDAAADAPFDDPAYDDAPLAAAPQALEDAPEAPESAEELDDDEDWARLYPGAGGGTPGPDTLDGEGVDEETVVGGDGDKR